MSDIEDLAGPLLINDKNTIYGIGRHDNRPYGMTSKNDEKLINIMWELLNESPKNDTELKKFIMTKQRIYHITIKQTELLYIYRTFFDVILTNVVKIVQRKQVRSHSGINNITTSLPGYYNFNGKTHTLTCPHHCGICPHVPGLPVSYMKGEPAVDRGLQIGFDSDEYIIKVTLRRLIDLYKMGHLIDKLEIRFLGGTWHAFIEGYRYQVILDTFYVANIVQQIIAFMLGKIDIFIPRPKLSLLEEQLINETSSCRIIGICIETPPKYITKKYLREARIQGITRLEQGIQTIYEEHLTIIDRDFCPTHVNKLGIKRTKNCGFKVIGHWMHDLPTSTRESDINMNTVISSDPYYDMDEWKFYANQTVDFTTLKPRYDSGEFTHYSDEDLLEVSIDAIQKTPKHVRIIRFGRDTPTDDVYYGLKISNYRQIVEREMDRRCLPKSRDVRTREVKQRPVINPIMRCKKFEASDGTEYYLSFERNDDSEILYSHLRLRLSDDAGIDSELGETISYQNVIDEQGNIKPEYNYKVIFPELLGCALLRELHTYGKLVSNSNDADGSESQHQGFGEQLIQEACRIARENGYQYIAVIAGNSVRDYYRKFGFKLVGKYGYMIKKLYTSELNELTTFCIEQKNKIYAEMSLLTCFLYAIYWYIRYFL